ncbi:polyhydroxyalkanoic acid system family protein [Tsuneonella sp. YG55]|uniref:Polyhydroxyalkanoic acid system family protein n=1 Tax=Tsuneonella litorea TaxID=2976475 RepID=A0A9X2W3A0_9SPHN|nr:polyhydroxyalkanoic acid system family protein [Tsuneonella litorea]MCT2559434.1 polyhydroxyalkanoic acid system family protein [Tsuneonella litorea]
MRVAIPHQLEKDEVRRRLKANTESVGDHIPGGAGVSTAWPSEDRMTMDISAMGQSLRANVDVEANQVVLSVDLPPALAFVEPMIAGAIRSQGDRLLAPPKD